jgi:hypothetical protein
MPQQAGYSGTPLAKKLGIKAGYNMLVLNAPDHYFDLFDDFPEQVKLQADKKANKDLIHFFVTEAKQFYTPMPMIKKQIVANGMIWVSWPKKASKMVTDITEDSIRNWALENGLVDVKVCAVDAVWSGLKLVIPVKDRPKTKS